jgi:F0F1-type ATP synthase assembly protein I
MTAVEWFQEQIIKIVNGKCELSEIEIYNIAKEMEHEQLDIRYLTGLIVGILVGASLGWFMFT